MENKLERQKYNIGKNIREFRMEHDWTQEEMITKLEQLGVRMSRGTYSHIECGIDNIRVKELLALAEIFHVRIGDFFKGISLR